LAIQQSEASPGVLREIRVEREKAFRFTPHPVSKRLWPDVVFAFHDNEEIGPRMLARITKVTGLKPEDL
jgi:hypothetical protein